jgi:glutathione S-transferase
MRLHQFSFSPFAAKVRKCLELKGLAHELVEVPYLDRRELVALTGRMMVPVLEDGGQVIEDSPRITAYLDERYAPSLRQDPLAPVIEGWADLVLEDVAFRVAAPGLHDRFAALSGRPDGPAFFQLVKERRYGPGALDGWRAAEWSLADQLGRLLAPIARALAARPFILESGPHASLADAAVYGQLHMVEAGRPGFVAERLPALATWFARVREARGKPA